MNAKLEKQQQVLINLITRVGGKQNIQKWMDELLKIDVKLEKMSYLYRIEFSDSEDILSSEELTALAAVWEGQVKRGDILTNIYPEDVCDDEKFFPVRADWVDYKPKFFEEVEIPPYIPPTREEYEAAISQPSIGKAYVSNQRKICGWTLEEIIPEHQEWQTSGGDSYSRESSDGMRSARTSYEPVRHHQVTIPDTYVWKSNFDGYVVKTTEPTPPVYKHKYDFEWFLTEAKNQYWENYQKEEKKWEASLLDPAEEAAKAAKLAAEEAAKAVKLAAEEAAKATKLSEAALKVDAVWQQLLIDCPKAVKKGLADKADSHKVTSHSDIAQGAVAKFGKDCYYDPAKFEQEYLENVYKSELRANRNQVLNKKGLQIDSYDYVSRIDGKQVSIKADYISRHSKRVQRYGTEGVDITKLHHISDADGIVLPPAKSFERWLASI